MPRPRKDVPKNASELGTKILLIVSRELAELDRKSAAVGLEQEDVKRLEVLSKVLKSASSSPAEASVTSASEGVTDDEIEGICLDET